jgi:hypothetical protein
MNDWKIHKESIIRQPAEKVAYALDKAIMRALIEHTNYPEVLEAISNGGYKRELFYHNLMISCRRHDDDKSAYVISVLRGPDEKNAKEFIDGLESRVHGAIP